MAKAPITQSTAAGVTRDTVTPASAVAHQPAPHGVVVDATGTHPAPPPVMPPIDAAGESTPSPLTGEAASAFNASAAAERSRMDASARSASLDATVAEHLAAAGARLSPPLASPRAMPLPPVQMVGTKGSASPDLRGVDPLFDRRGTVEKLLTHPDAEVRQRAQEAQVAIHHGAADIGIKVRAALDFAKNREATR